MQNKAMEDVQRTFPKFFTPTCMKGFRTKLETELMDGKYFVISNQFKSPSTGKSDKRTYSAYLVNWEQPDMIGLGGINNHKSKAGALAAIAAHSAKQ